MFPFDHLVILYCWVIILLTVNFGRPLSDFTPTLTFHGAVITLILALAGCLPVNGNRWITGLRMLYPVIIMTMLYRALAPLIPLISTEFCDAGIVAWERAMFGFDLTIWFDRHANLFLTEIMSAGYFSYYFMFPGLALLLFYGRKETELKQYLCAACGAFFISYLLFILYPAAGPRFFQPDKYTSEFQGILIRPLVTAIVDWGGHRGGAMPSSHVAVAVVTMISALRAYGRRAYFMIPIVILLALGTIYGRFHYLADVLAGSAVGVVAWWLTTALYRTPRDGRTNNLGEAR